MNKQFAVILAHYISKNFWQNDMSKLHKVYKNWKTQTINPKTHKVVTEANFHKAIVKGTHQFRLANIAIDEAINRLNLSNDLFALRNANFESFEDLHKYVSDKILDIKGISNLTVYDTALKIGELLQPKLRPTEYVYVARGAMIGAKQLLGKQVVKHNLIDGIKLPISLFKQYFPNLDSIDIEVILCIYKDCFILNGVNPNIQTTQDIDNLYKAKKQNKKQSMTP